VLPLVLLTVSCIARPSIAEDNNDLPYEEYISGNLILDCTGFCGHTFLNDIPMLEGLHQDRDWHALRHYVLRHPFGLDMAYYFLGRAAEAQGNLGIAARYYETSLSPYVLECSSRRLAWQAVFGGMTWRENANGFCYSLDVRALAQSALERISEQSAARAIELLPSDHSFAARLLGAQSRLAHLGYFDGEANGVLDAETRGALDAFKEDFDFALGASTDEQAINWLNLSDRHEF
jgi:hypothetical protein